MPRKRKGPGRPPLGPDARSETVRVRVTPALLAQIRASAGSRPLAEWGLEAFELALARGSTR